MKCKEEIVVVGAMRTPFGRFGGSLRQMDIYDLGVAAMKAAVEQAKLAPEQIDEVWWGCGDTTNCKDPYTPVVARQSLLKAGLLETTPSVTLDKACVSGMSAANYAIGRILLGETEVALTGGATSFSTVPYLARNMRWSGIKNGGLTLEDPLFPLGYKDYAPVAVDSGNVADVYAITREMQDELSFESHKKYGKAYEDGFYKEMMAPLEVELVNGKKRENVEVVIDEQYRPSITMENLKKLKTIFGNPSITAGNSPGLNDGAAAQIVMKKSKAEELGIEPLYSIVDMVSIAASPSLLPVAPALAIKKALQEAELTLEDVDVIEINEAFAAVPLVSLKLLSCKAFMEDDYAHAVANIANYPVDTFDEQLFQSLLFKLNVNGGAVAIGHANTASGARIMMNAGYELRRRGGGIGVCAICGGLTQGDACIIKV